jgi:MATE family multidrug resistance protein
MGQQGMLGLYNFLGFWGFGVIVGYMLCFHVGWGLKGLWSGIVAGVFLTRWICT